MIKTVEILKNYWLPKSLISKLTGISNTTMILIYRDGKEISPRMKKKMVNKITNFLDELRESLDD